MSNLAKYLVRRFVAGLLTLLGVVVCLVALMDALPGDAARTIAGLDASPQEVARIRHLLGIGQPFTTQLWDYIDRLLHGTLGVSAVTGEPVLSEIGQRLPYTLELAAAATALGVLSGIVVGVLAATHRGRIADMVASVIGVAGISMPVYWLGILVIVLFAVKLRWLPPGGSTSPTSLILPAVTLSAFQIALVSRMTRASMLDHLEKDYVRTVRAKGVREWVTVRHALHNAFLPILTVISLQFGTLLGGAVVTETIFSWPGIGQLLVTSIQSRDFPTVQGIVLVFAAMFIVVNIITDLAYSLIDPRIRLAGR